MFGGQYGAPGEIRTPDLRIRSPTLYPAELQAHIESLIISKKYPFNNSNSGGTVSLMERKKLLAISDLDGTLVDTFDINFKAYKTALNLHGYTIDIPTFRSWYGVRWDVFLPNITNSQDKDKIAAIYHSKLGFYRTFMEDACINHALVSMLKTMASEFHIALCTGASRKNTMDILNYTGLINVFETIISGDDVLKPKPDPEGYIKIIKHYNISPTDTVIFEDSNIGVQAAKASGAQVHIVRWETNV